MPLPSRSPLFPLGALGALVVLTTGASGCAQILGYDDLTAAVADSSVDTATDSTGDALGDGADAADAQSPYDHPPDRPTGLPATPSGTGRTLTFAVKRLYMGTMTHLGETKSTAWKEWGYDLDGTCTTLDDSKGSIHSCTRAASSSDDVLVDGDRCRDNNFGAQIMALVTTFNKDVEAKTIDSILSGSGTIGVMIQDLDDGDDDGYAPGAIYSLDSFPDGTVPVWDGTDVRLVTDDSVKAQDISQPLIAFPKGYVKGNVWVSGDGDDFTLPFGLGGTALRLPMTRGRLTVPLDAGHLKSTSPSVIVGAIPVTELEKTLKPVAESAGLCPGNGLYDGLISKMLTFPDLVIGAPTLQDPTVACDGLSVGLGFDLAPVQPFTQVVAAPPTKPSQCP